jgi:hypothetical protein
MLLAIAIWNSGCRFRQRPKEVDTPRNFETNTPMRRKLPSDFQADLPRSVL